MNRIVAACEAVLAGGRMAEKIRGDVYRAWIACGYEQDGGRSLATLRTSCAIFVRGALHACGYPVRRTWYPGLPIFDGWLPLSDRSPSWVRYTGTQRPEPGDIFFVQSTANPNNCHVGIFLRETEPGVWRTAEGGGGPDGSGCAIGERKMSSFDARPLRGWWSARKLGVGEPEAEQPALPLAPPDDLAPVRRTLRQGSTGDDVRQVQRIVGVTVDGSYGPLTAAAVAGWQRARGLVGDGVWGPVSWTTYDRGGQP